MEYAPKNFDIVLKYWDVKCEFALLPSSSF
jgi:hypothetical protein